VIDKQKKNSAIALFSDEYKRPYLQ